MTHPRNAPPAGADAERAAFLRDLRALRDQAGLQTHDLAARAHYPEDTLRTAEDGPALPTLPVLEAYVRGCGARASDWEDRWRRLTLSQEAELGPALPTRSPTANRLPNRGASAGPVGLSAAEQAALAPGLARVAAGLGPTTVADTGSWFARPDVAPSGSAVGPSASAPPASSPSAPSAPPEARPAAPESGAGWHAPDPGTAWPPADGGSASGGSAWPTEQGTAWPPVADSTKAWPATDNSTTWPRADRGTAWTAAERGTARPAPGEAGGWTAADGSTAWPPVADSTEAWPATDNDNGTAWPVAERGSSITGQPHRPAESPIPQSPIPQSPIPQSPIPQSPIPQSPIPQSAGRQSEFPPTAVERTEAPVGASGNRTRRKTTAPLNASDLPAASQSGRRPARRAMAGITLSLAALLVVAALLWLALAS